MGYQQQVDFDAASGADEEEREWRQPRCDRERALKAEQLAAHWLYLGNRAKERGELALAERHYARAQRHHDEMNRHLGNGDGS